MTPNIAESEESCVVLFPSKNIQKKDFSDVHKINQFTFYKLGQSLAGLHNFKSYANATANFDLMLVLWQSQRELDALLKGNIQIQLSKATAQRLLSEVEKILAEYFPQREPNENIQIPGWKLGTLSSHATTFETVFNEEMQETATYYVPRRGIYYTQALVDSADEQFPKELAQFIPDKAKDDWKAAGRCLAFGMYTASGVHVARAVEGILESYYQYFCAKPGATLNGWQDYFNALTKVAKDQAAMLKPSEKALAELLQMKDDYRNPLMHPRTVLGEADASVLFMNGASLITIMAQDLKPSNNAQASLTLVPPAKDLNDDAGQSGKKAG